MNAGIAGDRVESLVIEHATRSALINGDRVKLTPTDFALLSALASRPGEVIPRKHLALEAFGAPMAPQDLNWRIWRLRKLAGDLSRADEERMIGTRWGQGYILNVHGAVTVVEGLEVEEEVMPLPAMLPAENEPAKEEPVQGALIDLTEEPTTHDTVTLAAAPAVADPIAVRRRYLRPKSVLVASAVATAALLSSWSAGYLLAGGREAENRSLEISQLDSEAPADRPKPSPDNKADGRNKARSKDKKQTKKRRLDRGSDGKGTTVLAAPPTSSGTARSAPAPAESNPDEKTPNKDSSQAAPALPAAPTRYLYHLVHPETGDHFVTTDSNTASEHQAKGYRGSAIARVYTSQESGTRALTTNQGTAWIFISSSPRTEPASQPVPLWYSTNNAGDFFYTTSESEARASGWSASLAGYARAL